MISIKKLILTTAFFLGFSVSACHATTLFENDLNEGRITHHTIVSYSEVLRVVREIQKNHPKRRTAVLSDWDSTVVSINMGGDDDSKFLRDVSTKLVIDTLQKKKIPVVVVTARFLLDPDATEEDYALYAQEMQRNTGLSFSEGSTIDFRATHALPGVFCKGITFTHLRKADVTAALIDHPESPIKADHYVFVDDNPAETAAMIKVFGNRREHLTVLHYPEQISVELHQQVWLKLNPFERLIFSLRHGYSEDATALLEKYADKLRLLKKTHSFPFLLDVLIGNNMAVAEAIYGVLEYDFQSLKADEIMAILKHLNLYQKEKTIQWFIGKLPHNDALVDVMYREFLSSETASFYRILEATAHAESLSPKVLTMVTERWHNQPDFISRFEQLIMWSQNFPNPRNGHASVVRAQ